MTSIGDGAFCDCSGLTGITIPNGLTTITIPESVTEIADYAFELCLNFTTIKGKKGSYAETYANEHEYGFVDIEEDNAGDNNNNNDNNNILMGT